MWQVHERTCLEIWKLANKELFGDCLKREPAFRVWDAGNCSGHFHVIYGNPVIEIHEDLFRQEQHYEVIDTIVHEMVHQLQWQQGRNIGHDAFFEEKMKEAWGE